MRPRNWAELEQRLGGLFGGGTEGAATAREILSQAVSARWHVTSLRDIDRVRRQVVFQKLSGVLLDLEDADGDVAFWPAGVRDLILRTVARFCDGAVIDGPEWRLDPSETDRVTYRELVAAADFADVAGANS
jgi:hypothetical protein